MKKIALLSAATAAAFVFAPAAANAAPPAQKLEVKLTSSTSGTKKKPKSVGITVSTGTTSQTDNPAKLKHTITYAKISMPKGIKLNYKSFPECKLPEDQVEVGGWCDENAPSSAVGNGTLEATVVDIEPLVKGTLTPYIGSNGRLIIRTKVDEIAVVDQPLIGKIGTASGGYTFDFNVPTSLQTPIEGADQQINDFKLNFKAKNAKKGKKKIGLVELVSCPKGGYVFKGEFRYKSGETVTTSTTVPCKQGK
ncbi:MAG: hypothetical protein JHD16_06525 [Solirubrobacteraceae bacterium]|nr:hypothetical protein [Solirubrobacteraceae bacterium]